MCRARLERAQVFGQATTGIGSIDEHAGCDDLLTEDGPEREPAGAVGGFRIGAHLLVEQVRVVADEDAPPARRAHRRG